MKFIPNFGIRERCHPSNIVSRKRLMSFGVRGYCDPPISQVAIHKEAESRSLCTFSSRFSSPLSLPCASFVEDSLRPLNLTKAGPSSHLKCCERFPQLSTNSSPSETLSTTAFYYGADNWPEQHVHHDIRHKLCSQLLPSNGRYVVLLSRLGQSTLYKARNDRVLHESVKLPSVMSSAATLRWFLSTHLGDLSRLRHLFFCSHSTGYHLHCDDLSDGDHSLGIREIGRTLEELGVHLDCLYFDACCCANIDVLYAVRNVTRNVVAFQTYCPWEGLISSSSMINPCPLDIARNHLERYDSRAQHSDECPSDISVLSTIGVEEIYHEVKDMQKELCLFNEPLAYPEYPHHEEARERMYDIITALRRQRELFPSKAVRSSSLEREILNRLILYYGKSRGHTLRTHGLSMFLSGPSDVYFEEKRRI